MDDERFKHLANDPRFRQLRKRQRKVQIDDRFKSMFTDEKFTLKFSRDKRGNRNKKTSGDDLRRYYSLEQSEKTSSGKQNAKDVDQDEDDQTDESEAVESADEETNQVEDEEEQQGEEEDEEETDVEADSLAVEEESNVTGTGESASSAGETDSDELSSSSDESESEAESVSDDDRLPVDRIQYNWAPLDYDAEKADSTTNRLAIQNLDWDQLDVKDLYTLVNSVRPPTSVKIYVSEFGKERLSQEEKEGPKEIVEMPQVDEEEEEYRLLRDKMIALKDGGKSFKVNEYVDADDEFDPKNEELRERIRRYQLSRMKYFYAVAEFDSAESAEAVYKELDGMEYEGSSLELDLRFIPDDVEFDECDLRAECNKLPDLTNYSAPQFINSALQQTKVRFSWDETDVKRQEKLRRAFNKEELEKDDLEAYLGSESDSSEDEEENGDVAGDSLSMVSGTSRAKAEKYRRLLEALEEEKDRKKKVDVDVEWGDYSDDEAQALGEASESPSGESSGDLLGDSSDDLASDSSSDHEADRKIKARSKRKGNEKTMRKKDLEKELKRDGRKKGSKTSKGKKSERKDDADEESGELDLLVMDSANGARSSASKDNFQFDPDDERFKAVYESGLYNIDPSHPSFKRTEALAQIAERKRAKRLKMQANH